MKRTLISLDRRSLVARINAGDPLAIAEGRARNESRARKGKAPVRAYEPVGVTAPAPAPAPAPAEDMISAIVAEAVAAALAARGITPAPAPEPETHTDDRAVWKQCLADANGSNWEAYDRMESIIGKRQRNRIAAASGFTVGTIANGISKFRRGIKPDLSFAGK